MTRHYVDSTLTKRRHTMMDVVYVGVTLAFFGLSWALIKLCEHL